jgi:hypothetical protein
MNIVDYVSDQNICTRPGIYRHHWHGIKACKGSKNVTFVIERI